MLKVWAACVLLYAVLPFQLIDREFTLQGAGVLALFLGSFWLGTAMIAAPRQAPWPAWQQPMRLDRAERMLAVVGVVTMLAMLADLRNKSIFDLGEAYEARSDQATALMEGAASSSSLAFQLAFMTYPAAFVYIALSIIYSRRPNYLRLTLFGLLPVAMATLSMGGRAPLLYALLLAMFAYGARKTYLLGSGGGPVRRISPAVKLAIAAVLGLSFYYFVAVFFARAEVGGGASGMFDVAEAIWGIGFRGDGSRWMFDVLGEEVTYVIFIFTWYVVQGLIMGNVLFTNYDGPMQLGVYGVDLVSALMRRLDGELVARNFAALDRLNTYGFLPAAWGSLYVDFHFFGLAIACAWGALAALVYQRIRSGRDARWMLLAPFVTMGILFSFINTPIGFSNGLVIHFWAILAFWVARPRRARVARAPAPSPAHPRPEPLR